MGFPNVRKAWFQHNASTVIVYVYSTLKSAETTYKKEIYTYLTFFSIVCPIKLYYSNVFKILTFVLYNLYPSTSNRTV